MSDQDPEDASGQERVGSGARHPEARHVRSAISGRVGSGRGRGDGTAPTTAKAAETRRRRQRRRSPPAARGQGVTTCREGLSHAPAAAGRPCGGGGAAGAGRRGRGGGGGAAGAGPRSRSRGSAPAGTSRGRTTELSQRTVNPSGSMRTAPRRRPPSRAGRSPAGPPRRTCDCELLRRSPAADDREGRSRPHRSPVGVRGRAARRAGGRDPVCAAWAPISRRPGVVGPWAGPTTLPGRPAGALLSGRWRPGGCRSGEPARTVMNRLCAGERSAPGGHPAPPARAPPVRGPADAPATTGRTMTAPGYGRGSPGAGIEPISRCQASASWVRLEQPVATSACVR